MYLSVVVVFATDRVSAASTYSEFNIWLVCLYATICCGYLMVLECIVVVMCMTAVHLESGFGASESEKRLI